MINPKALSKKQLIRDNTDLESRLESCYASNMELSIINDRNENILTEKNWLELIEANNQLRAKHTRIRKRLTEIMEQFNITYNHKDKKYEIKS